MRARPPPGIVAVVASLLFAAMALSAKAASSEVGAAQLGFVRSAFGVLACAGIGFVRPLRPRNFRGLFGRGLAGAGAVYLYFTAIAHLPVGIATLLNYTAPVFTALWCAALFGERTERRTLLALATTTVGLALVLRAQAPAGHAVGRWELVGIAAAIVSGLAMALVPAVRRTDGPVEIFCAFSIGCLLVMAPEAITTWRAPSAHGWLLLTAMGASSVAAQVLMTWAMGYMSATLGGVIGQLTPVTSLAAGALAFHERYSPLAYAGIGLTLAGGAAGAVLGSRAAAVSPDVE